jgi:hypothetical protein
MSTQVAKSFLPTMRWVVLALALLALAMGAFIPGQVVNAWPSHEVEHQYFDGPDYNNQVGTKFVTCHGIYTFGQVTQWVVSLDGGDC